MSDLKERIQIERKDFDQLDLSNDHLIKFKRKLSKGESKSTLSKWYYAAAAVIILMVGLGLWNFNKSATKELSEFEQTTIPVDDASHYYQKSVNSQLQLLATTYKDEQSKTLIEQSDLLLQDLERVYQNLENQLKESGDERVAIAMINNYKLRIEILEKLAQQLKYTRTVKNRKYENPAT